MSASIEWRPDGAMTIEHAAALWADVRAHLANSDTGSDAGAEAGSVAALHVDLSAVDRFDTAGCQVLLACREEARRRGAAWRLTGCGSHVIDAMRLLGCEDTFAAPDDEVTDAGVTDAGATDAGVTEEKAR